MRQPFGSDARHSSDSGLHSLWAIDPIEALSLAFATKTLRPDSGPIDGMTGISRADTLRLFKQLLRYSQTLTYTDRHFYLSRVRHEFDKNKCLTDPKDIEFFYQVSDGPLVNQPWFRW